MRSGSNLNPRVIQYGLPFIVLVPPLTVAVCIKDIGDLVSYTGAYGMTGGGTLFRGHCVVGKGRLATGRPLCCPC